MQLLTTKHFNGYALDCYVEPEPEHTGDFWATREQIGMLLEYENPEISIANIHNRHTERLDKFSTLIKLIRVEGGRDVSREVTVYSFKGLLEICRYSQQSKADAVMDWLWEVADEIRRTGNYSVGQETASPALCEDLKAVQLVLEPAGITGNQLSLALDKVYKSHTGRSALQVAGVQLVAPTKEQLLTPTDIGKVLGVSAQVVNSFLLAEGYQNKLPNGKYEPTEKGEPYAVMLDVGKKRSDGTPVRQLKWTSTVVDELSPNFN